MTQEQLAELCSAAAPPDAPNVRQADISRWERGETPQAPSIPPLADALGVEIRWLINGEGPRDKAPALAATGS